MDIRETPYIRHEEIIQMDVLFSDVLKIEDEFVMCLVTCQIWDYRLLSNKGQVIAIALLGIYPREMKTCLHKCSEKLYL